MKIPITIKSQTRRADKSVNLKVNTNLEMGSSDVAILDELILSEVPGYLVMNEEPTELPKPEPKSVGLTKSQQLRREIELSWEGTEKTVDKETYYEEQMDKYIAHARSKRQ